MYSNLLSGLNFSSIKRTGFKCVSRPISFKAMTESGTDEFKRSNCKPLSIQEQVAKIKEIEDQIEVAKSEAGKAENAWRANAGNTNSHDYWQYWEDKKKELIALKTKREEEVARHNPNTAFLYDTNTSWSERKRILAEHSEIIALVNLNNTKDWCFDNLYRSGNYFVLNKTSIGNFLDTSWAVNKQNYARLSKDGLASYSQICKMYNFTEQDLKRYIAAGLLKPISLTNLHTQEEEQVHIIDLTDDENKAGLNRHKKITGITLESIDENVNWISVEHLSRLGFGSIEDLNKDFKSRRFQTTEKKQTTPEGEVITTTYVAFRNSRNIGELKYLRNECKTTVNIEQLAKIAKVDITDLEDAILSGEIEYIPTCIFKGEEHKLFFNLKNRKNIEYINKKQFEYEIIQEQIKAERREKSSLRAKIAWRICPKTSAIARSIFFQDIEYKALFEKIDNIKDYNIRKANGKIEEGETEPYLTKAERIKLKTFYKRLWEQAGTDEYRSAMATAKEAIKLYKEFGINSIENEEVRKAIEEFNESK